MALTEPTAQHDWSVGFRVVGGGYGIAVYVARCTCGWEAEYDSELNAARSAAAHAGVDWTPAEKPKRHSGPLQSERLFEV